MSADAPGADWHSPAPYAPLARCDRHGFAWEWLRRTHAYRTACARQLTAAEERRIAAQFGLHRLESPNLAWPQARPLWRRDVDRSEEHTSELQSLMRISYAVFCLKKKKKKHNNIK